jgi:hypothetical protein
MLSSSHPDGRLLIYYTVEMGHGILKHVVTFLDEYERVPDLWALYNLIHLMSEERPFAALVDEYRGRGELLAKVEGAHESVASTLEKGKETLTSVLMDGLETMSQITMPSIPSIPSVF